MTDLPKTVVEVLGDGMSNMQSSEWRKWVNTNVQLLLDRVAELTKETAALRRLLRENVVRCIHKMFDQENRTLKTESWTLRLPIRLDATQREDVYADTPDAAIDAALAKMREGGADVQGTTRETET